MVSGRGFQLRSRLGREILKTNCFKHLRIQSLLQKNLKDLQKNGWHHKNEYLSQDSKFLVKKV